MELRRRGRRFASSVDLIVVVVISSKKERRKQRRKRQGGYCRKATEQTERVVIFLFDRDRGHYSVPRHKKEAEDPLCALRVSKEEKKEERWSFLKLLVRRRRRKGRRPSLLK